MKILIPIVHKSHIITAKKCLKLLEYNKIFNVHGSYVNESALLGEALHDSIMWLHQEAAYKKEPWGINASDLISWYSRFRTKLNDIKDKYHKSNIEVINRKEEDLQEHLEMLAGYMQKPYNRFAEPILLEKTFQFCIKIGRKGYWFQGTIDQLLRIEIRYLEEWGDLEFTDEHLKSPLIKDGKVYVHRDIKTGDKIASYTDIEFNDDINTYAYGLAYGFFDINNSGKFNKQIKLLPYAHCLYFIKDHLTYKRAYRNKKAGDERGNGMYYAFRQTLEDIELVKQELIKCWELVNNGAYPRTGAMTNTCNTICNLKDYCIAEFKGRLPLG